MNLLAFFSRYLILLGLGAATVCAAASWPGRTDQHPLTADQAFQMMPLQRDAHGVKLEWVIAPGYFLYRDRIKVKAVAADRVLALKLPPAQPYDEPGAGQVRVYRNDLTARLPLSVTVTPRRLKVRFQGCSDSGICYPPQTRIMQMPKK